MSDNPTPGDIRVWYIPQIGGPKFEYPVPDLATAAAVLDALGKFALFEYTHQIKPDYADVGGVYRYDDFGDGPQWYGVDELELAAAVEERRKIVESCPHDDRIGNEHARWTCTECGTDCGPQTEWTRRQ
jgi:hypothetical protein